MDKNINIQQILVFEMSKQLYKSALYDRIILKWHYSLPVSKK